MPRSYSSIEKIHAELAWLQKCQILTNVAAATFAATKKLDTRLEHVCGLSQRSSGPSDGSTSVGRAGSMDSKPYIDERLFFERVPKKFSAFQASPRFFTDA